MATTNHLQQAIGEAGISQAELARRVEVERSTISLLVSGNRLPSLPLAQRIAVALGTTVDALWPPLQAAANE